MSAHKPELDNMTPAQIRVLCEELLYTMDIDQREKIALKLPGLYKMVYGTLPQGVIEQLAIKLAADFNEPFQTEEKPNRQFLTNQRCLEALQNVGL